ncbi:succinate dehydrogenase, cytochrome b556 subunit [Histidinibacterium aquaticum]|uniref:Succinate dehydrogenase cytochrome b556 subunit n=1 Tax=Histidinibacterium aquaticum TaxID=2613962 RepID=A0A5J5GB24_9RHOB|nr:succinate dehydrogenase, cytochrome b556 subunit [Histidinibacterium aquaticum]KAA9005228.1 succinate dehydrogenase, cytochrome b556 subunit [Histidinibacterium aquaticum]
MADVNRGNRPLSPFMIGQYYRPQMTSMTSIFTRITGNALVVAGLLIAWWFVALATGPEAYARANGFITSWFGDLVMFLSVAAFWYHLFAGVRHLIWDNGHMLGVKESETYGLAMIVASVILTIFTAIVL